VVRRQRSASALVQRAAPKRCFRDRGTPLRPLVRSLRTQYRSVPSQCRSSIHPRKGLVRSAREPSERSAALPGGGRQCSASMAIAGFYWIVFAAFAAPAAYLEFDHGSGLFGGGKGAGALPAAAAAAGYNGGRSGARGGGAEYARFRNNYLIVFALMMGERCGGCIAVWYGTGRCVLMRFGDQGVPCSFEKQRLQASLKKHAPPSTRQHSW